VATAGSASRGIGIRDNSTIGYQSVRESQAWSGGADVDVAAHDEWREILRVGGDAGELAR